MKCPTPRCHSERTHLLTRTLVLQYDTNGVVVGAQVREQWLCRNCGEPFRPAATRVEEWNRRPVPYGKHGLRPTKAAINRELFRAPEA